MTKSELRTGNVLQYRGREVVVLEIRQDDFLVRDMGLEMAFHYGSSEVSGIPISEGWLKKRLGGIKLCDLYDFDLPSGGCFSVNVNPIGKAYVEDGSGGRIELPAKIEFVHTIQNAFYFLFGGQELEINLKQ